jgi:hypothetical protein
MRELAVPLQALLAMLTCLGLMWMVYTMAFFDPNPPTAAEVHALEEQDPQMLVYKTAAAMTVDALLFGPTQILLPVTGPSLTPMPTTLLQSSSLSTLVVLPTLTPTSTRRPAGPTPTTRSGGDDPILGLPTATPIPPTRTAVPTATAQPSATAVPPTAEPSETSSPDPTEEPTAQPTATEAPTEDPTEEPTEEPTEPPVTESVTEPASTDSAP